jgi:hypothetical protein
MIRLLILLSMFMPLAPAAQPAEPIPRPEVKVGDRWTYRATGQVDLGAVEYEIQVTLVDEKSIVGFATRKRDGKEIDAIWTPDWNVVSGIDGMTFRPSGGLLQFPLAVGKQYRHSFEAERPRDGKGITRVSMTVVVVGWETVEVPAGKFRALRVEATHDGRRNGPQVTAWYAPEVKRYVRLIAQAVRSSREEVLLGYKLN